MNSLFYHGRIAARLCAAALCGLGLLAAGCGKEPDAPVPAPVQLQEVELSLKALPLEGPDKVPFGDAAQAACEAGDPAAATRAVSGIDESKIYDVWVLQFDSDGGALLSAPQYIQSLNITSTGAVPCRLVTGGDVVMCDVWVIANTHDASLFSDVTSLDELFAKQRTLTAESSLPTSKNVLPMVGNMPFYPSDLATSPSSCRVDLCPSVAKLTVTTTSSATFKVTSVKVCKVPKVLAYAHKQVSPSTAATCHPATSSAFFDQYVDLGTGGWCYLPPNMRGNGTATTEKNKTAATALGGASGQGNYATYLEVKIAYMNNGVDTGKGATARIYLGTNNITSYNVSPAHAYTYKIAVSNVAGDDARFVSRDMVESALSLTVNGWVAQNVTYTF